MIDSSDWKVCLEAGLNHLGSFALLERMINDSGISELDVAVTVQIKEETFYSNNKKFYLSTEEHRRFIDLCCSLDIPCGLALGPISDLKGLFDSGLQPDFIKTLSTASSDPEFLSRIYSIYDCPKYISVGLSEFSYIEKYIIPLMKNTDRLIHTSLSHTNADQNLGDIRRLAKLGVPVSYGLHATNHDLINTSVGAGADSVFCYFGDKSLALPDFDHAIDISDVDEVVAQVNASFSAMGQSDAGDKNVKINFIG